MVATVAAGARSDRRIRWVVTGLLVVPALVLLVRVLQSGWLSSSDWADIELRARDVGTAHTPLVGAYSRYGWNHPGPLLFYVLALPYRVLGARGYGILAGALIVNGAAVACTGAVLWRRGRTVGLMLGLAVVLVLARALGAGFLIDPWNPYVIVLPLLAVVALAWAAADGDLWALPIAVGLGSFVVQSHVGAALAVVVPIGVSVCVIVLDARRNRGGSLKPIALVTTAVAVICWLPPVVQQFQTGGGNLGHLIDFWTQSHARTVGWSAGTRIVFAQLAIPAPWFSGHERLIAVTGGVDPHWNVPVALILLVAAGIVALRTRDRQSFTLDAVALAMVVAAMFSAAHIVDAPFFYIVRWTWAVGAIVWIAILWTFWRALLRHADWDVAVTRFGVAAIVVLAATLVVGAVHAEFPVQSEQRALKAIAPAARRALRQLRAPILVEGPVDFRSGLAADGVVLIAIHAGIDARLALRSVGHVGRSHAISKASARSIVVVAVDDGIEKYRSDPSYRSIAAYDPLSPDERAYHAAVNTEARRAYAGGITAYERWSAMHQSDLARVHDLDERGQRMELFQRRVGAG
jgi:hypothetical protein